MSGTKNRRPSFSPPPSSSVPDPRASTGWVYRSDAPSVPFAVDPEPDPRERARRADALVTRFAKWAALVGLVPAPLFDLAVTTGIQLRMVSELARLYEVPFARHRARALLGALVGAVTAPVATGAVFGAFGTLFKLFPGVGTVVGVVTMPAFNGASTLAVGRVFIQHLEAGGTALDIDPDRFRADVSREMAAASVPGAEPGPPGI